MKNSYWEQTGKHQKEYDELYKKLVPYSGKAETEIGEILRISSKFYYDLYNNGCANVSNHKEDYKKLVDYCLENLDNEIVDDDGLHFIQDIIDADDGFSYEEFEDNNFDIEELVEDFENDINKQEALENLVDQIIVHVNENYLKEKEKIMEKVRNQSEPGIIFSTIKKYKDDFNIVLECVKQDGMFLDFASDELRNNKEICLAAIKNNKAAFTFFSNELRDDKEFILECAKHNGYILEIMDDNYKDDYDIVMAAVKNDGHTLEFASERLANNKEIVREAIYSDNDSLQFASNELRNDKDIVLAAIKNSSSSLIYASDNLKDDKEFILECVKQDGWTLEYTTLKLQKDLDIVLAAIKNDGHSLTFASDELKDKYGHNSNDFIKNLEAELNLKNIISLDDSLDNLLMVIIQMILLKI